MTRFYADSSGSSQGWHAVIGLPVEDTENQEVKRKKQQINSSPSYIQEAIQYMD